MPGKGAGQPALVDKHGCSNVYCAESKCRVPVPSDMVSLVNVERALQLPSSSGTVMAKIRNQQLRHCDCIIASTGSGGRLLVVAYELKSGLPPTRDRKAVEQWAERVAEKLLTCSALARDLFSWARTLTVECKLALPRTTGAALGGNILGGSNNLWIKMRKLIEKLARQLGLNKNLLYCQNYQGPLLETCTTNTPLNRQ